MRNSINFSVNESEKDRILSSHRKLIIEKLNLDEQNDDEVSLDFFKKHDIDKIEVPNKSDLTSEDEVSESNNIDNDEE